MKTLKYIAISAVIMIGLAACEKKNAPIDTFVPVENNFGAAHNEGLELIFNSLNISPKTKRTELKASSKDLIQRAITVTNNDIRLKAGNVAYNQAQKIITQDLYTTTTPNEVQKQMSTKEQTLLENTLNAVSAENKEELLSIIKSDIIKDNSLSSVDKQKFFDMIDIIESSYSYWIVNEEPPIGIEPEGISFVTQQIIASDCIWFWQAGLASGLNPIVTIGVSAVGSFAAWAGNR